MRLIEASGRLRRSSAKSSTGGYLAPTRPAAILDPAPNRGGPEGGVMLTARPAHRRHVMVDYVPLRADGT